MQVQTSMEQVAGILARDGFTFQIARGGRQYRLLFGSAGVFIRFADLGRDSVVITVSSPVLQDVDEESPGAALALNLLNDLNSTHYFVRFTFGDGMLMADYDLLGDDLQAEELRNAILTVAAVADRLDDQLLADVGGRRFRERQRPQRRFGDG
jgi:hypothetical protein